MDELELYYMRLQSFTSVDIEEIWEAYKVRGITIVEYSGDIDEYAYYNANTKEVTIKSTYCNQSDTKDTISSLVQRRDV